MNRTSILRAFAAEPWAMWGPKLDELHARLEALPERPRPEDLEALNHPDAGPVSRRGSSVAEIRIHGVMVPRASLFSLLFGGTPTETLVALVQQAAQDETIGGLVLNIDSPGGSIAMLPELADAIYEARQSKPVIAVGTGIAASAAYWAGASASEFYAAPSALVGAIGIITTRVDISEQLAAEGIKVKVISAGKYKAEGHPATPITDEEVEATQSLVDEAYAGMIGQIARGRGVKPADVRNGFGEGRVVSAREGKRIGMVDEIGQLGDAIARIGNPRARIGRQGYVVVPALTGYTVGPEGPEALVDEGGTVLPPDVGSPPEPDPDAPADEPEPEDVPEPDEPEPAALSDASLLALAEAS